MALGKDYSLADFGIMIADDVRMGAYVRAVREHLKPGDIVIDLGSGPGVFAILACQLGAEHVYAIDPSPSIEYGPALAQENGCADRITFMPQLSTEIELPRRADLIISDLRGALPLFRHHIASLADARERLLAPGGVLLPQQDTLWVAPVNVTEDYPEIMSGWDVDGYGVRSESVRRVMTSNMWGLAMTMRAEQLLAPPVCWATLDYTTRTDPNVRAEVAWTVEQAGLCHGLAAWFDAVIAPGITFSNAPGQTDAVYGRGFFPWRRPVELEVGDRVEASLRATLIGDNYVWAWATRVAAEDGATKQEFRQSSLHGSSLTPTALQAWSADFQPRRTEDGEVALMCLTMMDAAHSVGEIAHALVERFPHRFPTEQAALDRASALASTYG